MLVCIYRKLFCDIVSCAEFICSCAVGYVQATINTYERSSSATAYLEGLAANRSNLHLLIGTTATEVVSNGTLHGKVSFNAVKMAQSENGILFKKLQ